MQLLNEAEEMRTSPSGSQKVEVNAKKIFVKAVEVMQNMTAHPQVHSEGIQMHGISQLFLSSVHMAINVLQK